MNPAELTPDELFGQPGATSYGILTDALPIAFGLLNVTDKKDVYVIDERQNRSFMSEETKYDHAVKTVGINSTLPYLTTMRKHETSDYIGQGIILYKTRDCISEIDSKTGKREPITYCLISYIAGENNNSYLVCRKNETFRLMRYFKSKDKSKVLKFPPVLAPGLLHGILENTIGFLDKREEFEAYDVKPTRGIVLHGKPGNGKTMVCKWIRTKCEENTQYRSIVISPAQIEAAYGRGTLKDMIDGADIVFFDDMDLSFFTRRDHSGNPKLACALLAALDGVDESKGSVRIFTTNELIGDIDTAFRRPGRIDKIYAFHNPTPELRRTLFDKHWHLKIKEAIDADKLINSTNNCSFAEFNEIKTLLVQHMLSTGKFDLDNALHAFKHRMIEDKPKKFGFAAADAVEEEDDSSDSTEDS